VFPVIDEAYAEFVSDPDFQDAVGLFREGYPVVPAELATTVDGIRNSFNINNLAQAAALAALKDREHVERTRQTTFSGRDQLLQGLTTMGLKPMPSQTNFVCVGIRPNAPTLFERLLTLGLMIRPLAGFAMPEHIRIPVGTAEPNSEVLVVSKEELGRG
jgi:histidinol-phosphate aminotransferase